LTHYGADRAIFNGLTRPDAQVACGSDHFRENPIENPRGAWKGGLLPMTIKQTPCGPSKDHRLSCDDFMSSAGGHSGHAVHFYDNDQALVNAVSAFLRAGFAGGQTGLIIATPEHAAGIDAALAESGINVAELKENQRYVSLDAAQTLSKFMVNGSPDRNAFHQIIGRLVAANCQATGLRAFGEMVALLWADNNHAAAIELEELWNELGKEQSFSLLCGYPTKAFPNHTDGAPFQDVCNAHSHVLPSQHDQLPNVSDEANRTIAILQQKAAALEAEVAERKSAELELRDFLENATEGIHKVGPDGKIIWANKAELDLLGYEAREYIGHSIEEFHADAPVIADILERLKRGETLRNYQARLKHKNGSLRYVSINSSATLDNGRFAYTKCFTRDMTDRAIAQTTHQLLSAIIESSDDAIISKDTNGVITSWNRGAERIFGYTSEEAIGKSITMLIPNDRLSEETNILQRIRKGERIDHFETIRRCKDGTLLNISLTVSPIKNADGQVIGASKVARDITDRVRAKEKLEQLVSERTSALRDVVAELETFSYSIAHDMRAPLRAMQGYARLVREDYEQILPDEGRDFLQRIASAATRLDGLITDVLQYSRISRGEMPLEKVDLERLTREIVETYPEFRMCGARIIIESPIPAVIGNGAALTQTLSNLISNACKYVRPEVVSEIRIHGKRSGSLVRLYVEDNGIGISEEGQKRIFHMFHRLNPASTFEGTGLGLTIVRRAVERMGGKVGVESELGKGSRFWIELKRAD
jgi:PAS domain S-box-containing protein